MVNADDTLQTFASTPEFSVLIGRVSTEDESRILETLNSLRAQEGGHALEIIVADRKQDAMSRTIQRDYPEVILLPCPARMTLPQMRALAFDQARASIVIVTEDHCVPSRDWIHAIKTAFTLAPNGTVAVGGCVENGVRESVLDWATFLCEYSSIVTPVVNGETTSLPGMNTAYRRSVLMSMDQERLTQGFWETTVHPLLLKQGMKLYSSDQIRLNHCKKFSFHHFASQRFMYSRYYAAQRYPRHQKLRRAVAFCGSVLLPALLMYRSHRDIRSKPPLLAEYYRASPILLIFFTIWAIGEMTGYLLGEGGALAQIE